MDVELVILIAVVASRGKQSQTHLRSTSLHLITLNIEHIRDTCYHLLDHTYTIGACRSTPPEIYLIIPTALDLGALGVPLDTTADVSTV